MTTLLIILSVTVLVSTFLAGKVVLAFAKSPLQYQLVGAGGVVSGVVAASLMMVGLTAAPAMADDSGKEANAASESIDDVEAQIRRRFTKSDDGKIVELDDDDSPIADVVFPDNRPQWVEQVSIRKGDMHSTSVASDLHLREQECDRTLKKNIKVAVDEYINDYLGDDKASMLLRYDWDYIEDRLIGADGYFEETVKVSFGSMHQSHARLEFDTDFREELETRWEEVLATSRLLTVGLGSAGVLGLLSIAFGYLRLDTATKGYYTGRLQFLAAVAILSLIAAGSLFVRLNGDWLRWF